MSAAPPLKNTRAVCYQARDSFYQCCREQAGVEFTPGAPVPSKCKKFRSAFEKACLPSWVEHFDRQQEATARRAQQVYAEIRAKGDQAAGSLSGKAQH